jgi:prepilin signal peptidase PulO-like enzyme (type II secretory pathway)
MLSLIMAVIGLLVGGLINVLADDLPDRVSPELPHCPRCGHIHSPSSWLAVARLFQGGACPSCGMRTRRRAILAELSTALIFALMPLWIASPLDLAIYCIYMAVLILIVIIDLEHRLVLHVVTFPTTLLAIAGSYVLADNSIRLALVGAAVGFLLFLLVFWVGQRLFGPGALGFGDVTLAMMMGAMLGFHRILFALILGIFLAGFWSLLALITRRMSRRTYFAYGPFLAIGGMVMLVWGTRLVDWYTSL